MGRCGATEQPHRVGHGLRRSFSLLGEAAGAPAGAIACDQRPGLLRDECDCGYIKIWRLLNFNPAAMRHAPWGTEAQRHRGAQLGGRGRDVKRSGDAHLSHAARARANPLPSSGCRLLQRHRAGQALFVVQRQHNCSIACAKD